MYLHIVLYILSQNHLPSFCRRVVFCLAYSLDILFIRQGQLRKTPGRAGVGNLFSCCMNTLLFILLFSLL
jgi:hypothetical protein